MYKNVKNMQHACAHDQPTLATHIVGVVYNTEKQVIWMALIAKYSLV